MTILNFIVGSCVAAFYTYLIEALYLRFDYTVIMLLSQILAILAYPKTEKSKELPK